MNSQLFESHIKVTSADIDELKHVNNVVYLKWVQDIAQQHWDCNTHEQLRNTYVWVVLNHYIEYHSPSFENDDLTIQTWIDNHRGAKTERHTKITHTQSKKIIVTAKTQWCLLSKKTLRPTRITEEISTLFT